MKRYNVTAIAPNRNLASGITSGASTLDLDSAPTGAPTTPFQIAVWEEQGDGSYSRSEMEVMEVTAISGATLTIGERGMEETTARSFSAGALVTIGLWTPSQLEHAIGFEEDAGQQSGTYEWDVDASPHLRIELTGDLTINASGIRNGRRVVLLLIQDSTGGRSLTLGNGFATANGEQLQISTDADAISALGGFTSGGAVIIDVGKSEAPSGELQVQTDAATGLDAGVATLNGELIALPDGESALASFEYRKTSGGVWVVTPEQTLNNPSTFNEALTGLDEVEHEFRARAESAGLIEVGNVLTFTPEAQSTVTGSDDFSGQTIGDPVAGYSWQWSTGTSQILSDATAIGGKAAQITFPSESRAAFVRDDFPTNLDDVELACRFKIMDSRGTMANLGTRIAGTAGSEDGVRFRTQDQDFSNDINFTVNIQSYVNGNFDTVGGFEFLDDLWALSDVGEWFLMRAQTIGNTHKVKVWRPGEPEPADFQKTGIKDVVSLGLIGFIGFSSASNYDTEVDWWSYSTDPNNTSAPLL